MSGISFKKKDETKALDDVDTKFYVVTEVSWLSVEVYCVNNLLWKYDAWYEIVGYLIVVGTAFSYVFSLNVDLRVINAE